MATYASAAGDSSGFYNIGRAGARGRRVLRHGLRHEQPVGSEPHGAADRGQLQRHRGTPAVHLRRACLEGDSRGSRTTGTTGRPPTARARPRRLEARRPSATASSPRRANRPTGTPRRRRPGPPTKSGTSGTRPTSTTPPPSPSKRNWPTRTTPPGSGSGPSVWTATTRRCWRRYLGTRRSQRTSRPGRTQPRLAVHPAPATPRPACGTAPRFLSLRSGHRLREVASSSSAR